MSQRVADTQYGAQNLDQFEFMHALKGYPPAPRRCQSRLELVSWFLKFATACRATLPAPEPS
jgi:hypothetical protein